MTFTIRAFRTDNTADMDAARSIREIVFCKEQGVPAEIEWDGKDSDCEHFIAEHKGEPAGTARLAPYGDKAYKVERVAVLKPYRGLGVGKAIMVFIMNRVNSSETLLLNAQIQVEDFYEQLGFVRDGEEFEEAGIPHVPMAWSPAS